MKFGQGVGVDEKVDASSAAWLSANQALAFKGQHHLMHGGWRDGEEPLHVGLGWRAAHHQSVGMDEGQILALLFGEAWVLGRGVHAT